MAVEVSSVCKSATHQTLRSLGVFAHLIGSTNLQIKAVELLKLSEPLTFEEFAAKLVDRFDLGKTNGDYKLQLWARCQRILKCLPIVSWNWWKMPTHSVIIQGETSKRPETKNGKKYS